jgi:hypothetical protein
MLYRLFYDFVVLTKWKEENLGFDSKRLGNLQSLIPNRQWQWGRSTIFYFMLSSIATRVLLSDSQECSEAHENSYQTDGFNKKKFMEN